MEVHHHPHVEKKNFKEYLLEGLMIFLAVSLGFFAENIRESISNTRQLNEYMQSMVSDLKSDQATYDSAIAFNLKHCEMVDSIITDLKVSKENTGKVYYLARLLTIGSMVISPNAKTFTQLNSTGGFRLIHDQSVADSIAAYYQWIKSFDYWSELQGSRLHDVIASNDKLFDASVFLTIFKKLENTSDPSSVIPGDNPPLMSNDPYVINEVMVNYQYYYGFLKLMNQRAQKASIQSQRLRALLIKEYHMEDK